MPSEALLVIDVQNDFCSGGALAVPDGESIVSLVNEMMPTFETVVLTQDWHPADHSSFASNHVDAEPFSLVEMPYGDQVLWPDHCVQGSNGAEFHPALNLDQGNIVVRKGMRAAVDSYSAFYENDHETTTGLAGYLRELGVAKVVLVGLAYDFCVQYSALDAADLGFEVDVIKAATRAIDMDGSAAAATDAMQRKGISIL